MHKEIVHVHIVRRSIVLIVLLVLSVAGCGSDGSRNTTGSSSDALTWLGLVDGRTLTYFQIDSLVTLDPSYQLTVTQSTFDISISGSGDDWVINRPQKPGINLKLGSNSALINGFWHFGTTSTLTYFAQPIIVMPRYPIINKTWSGFTPFYVGDSGNQSIPFYIANFGFYFDKTFKGVETVLVTAGEFDANRFDVLLYANEFDTAPVAEISEFYVPSIGIVKKVMRGGGLTRTLVLIDSP